MDIRKNKRSKQTRAMHKNKCRNLHRARVRRQLHGLIMFAMIQKRKTVVLKLPVDIPGILKKTKDINVKMTTNAALFDDPPVAMATNKTAIDKAFAAEAAMVDPDTEKTTDRDEAVSVIVITAFQYRDYVQTKVDADVAHALDIAQMAGMDIKGTARRQKQVWAVHYTGISQEIEVTGSVRAQRCAYEWQMTETPDNIPSWRVKEITTTLQSTTIVKGLEVGKYISFRYRIILKDGPTQWSDPIKVLII
jgi:hypothetical protein